MKLRILLTLYIIIGLPIALLAQRRQLQEARAIIKSGKNYDQAEKMMTKLLNDSANLHNPRIYDMWLLSVIRKRRLTRRNSSILPAGSSRSVNDSTPLICVRIKRVG